MVSPTERVTRQQIDHHLLAAGWNVNDSTQVRTELGIWAKSKAKRVAEDAHSEFADYALLGTDGVPLAIVEAKRSSRDALAGKRQAQDYADRIAAQYDQRPFIFLTNSKAIWFWNDEQSAPRQVAGYFTRYDLERLLFQRAHRLDLTGITLNNRIVDRPYQLEAIRRVYEGLEQRQRKFLLVMATGTGKTRTTVALIDGLIRARWVQKVLFLADRRELVRQALGDFKEHLPSETRTRIEGGEIDNTARIFVATYPSMLQALDQFSPGYFDLIIADESHRSIYNRYKAIFQHFDALQLGLTATPTKYIDHNTFELFECVNGLPNFVFPLETAVEEKYLVNYRVLAAQTRFQIKGIRAGELPPEVRQQLVERGIELSEVDYSGTDLERRVTNTGTNDALVREFMDKSLKDEHGALPRKSIIFAISHKHAVALWESFNRLYPQYRGHLAEVIDSHMERAEKLLDDFKRQDMPRVAISVDMLDTGIDIPSLCNLVFAKPIYSLVKFWQMIGRGTRRWRDPLTGWEKPYFLILDHWDNFAYFEMNPEGTIPTEPQAVTVRLFYARLTKWEVLQAQGLTVEAQATLMSLRADLAALPHEAAEVRTNQAQLVRFEQDAIWENLLASDLAQLKEIVAPLMRHRLLTPAEGEGLAFWLKVEQLATELIRPDAKQAAGLIESIQDDLARLPLTLNAVRAVAESLRQAQSPAFWDNLDYARVMSLGPIFAPLMRYREMRSRELIELDLPDEVIDRRWIVYGPAGEGSYVDTYREQVEARVRELADGQPALVKLRRGETPNETDLSELARMLNTPDLYVTEQALQVAYNQSDKGLLDFVRHILKLHPLEDREARLQRAFDDFIARHPHFTADQITFVRMVRTAILQAPPLVRADLNDAPFTYFGPRPAERLFTAPEVTELLAFANQFA